MNVRIHNDLPLIIRSPPGYYLVLATHQDTIVTHVSNLTYYGSWAYHINTKFLLFPPPQSLYNSLNSHSAMIASLLRLLIKKVTNMNLYYKISKHMARMLPLSWSLLQVQEPHSTSQPWPSFMINYTFQDCTSNKCAQTSTSLPSFMPFIILLYKRKLQNNQPLPNTHNHP